MKYRCLDKRNKTTVVARIAGISLSWLSAYKLSWPEYLYVLGEEMSELNS